MILNEMKSLKNTLRVNKSVWVMSQIFISTDGLAVGKITPMIPCYIPNLFSFDERPVAA